METDATDGVLDKLIAGNDLDELVREVDRRVAADDWAGLVRLRDRCRAALERGLQLWPAASLAEYRLALRAPAPWAAGALAEGAGRFALGPLTEVAASTHTWDELAPHLPDGPLAGVVAHERIVRGDDLRDAGVPFADVFDLPLALEPWEPRWPLATYRDDSVNEPRPDLPALLPVPVPAAAKRIDDADVESALLAVVTHWTSQSNGQAEVVSADGNAWDALSVLGARAARAGELDLAAGLAQIAWAGSSGGAHGRRRGAAAGRDLAWSIATALGGVDLAAELQWFAWDDGHDDTGWHLRLAIEDSARGKAWAIRARDSAD
jgi:hypothetical protein